jgi:hypothetical protein
VSSGVAIAAYTVGIEAPYETIDKRVVKYHKNLCRGEAVMLRRGVTLGLALSIVAWLWLRAQRGISYKAETTIHLDDTSNTAVQQSVDTILQQIEATAPWILKANEKSSTRS